MDEPTYLPQNVIYECVRFPSAHMIKVSAIDQDSHVEVSITCPINTPQILYEKRAYDKLVWVQNKETEHNPDDDSKGGIIV